MLRDSICQPYIGIMPARSLETGCKRATWRTGRWAALIVDGRINGAFFFVTWGAKLSNIVRVGTFYLTVKEEVGVISRAGTRTITLRIHSEYIDLKLTLIFTSCDSYACPKVLGIYNPPRARFLCSARMVAPLGKLFFPSLYHPILTSHHRVST